MTKALIKRAREDGHGTKNGCVLNDLELLAELQHYGAATCLIDFTTHSFVALYFACASLDNKTEKVVAFNSDNTNLYNEITNDTNKEISHWLTEHIRNKKLWVFSPPKELNNRIISQQSVFVFGSLTLSVENFHICEITNKKIIMQQLKENGTSAKMLFDDFVGFSTQNSHDKKYENWDTDSDFVSGRIYQASENYETTIKYYDKAINFDHQDSAAYHNRGTTKIKLKNYQDAISDYDEAIRLNPKDWVAYHNRGAAKEKLIKFQDALSDYDEAIRLNSEFPEAYHSRGTAKAKSKRYTDAISDFDKAIRLNPKNYGAYHNRGIAKNILNKFQDALSDFDKAIGLNPKDSVAYYNRGLTKIKLCKFQDAVSDFDKTIKLNPENYKAHHNRGLTKIKLGDKKGAVADFAKAKEINPEFEVPNLPTDGSNK